MIKKILLYLNIKNDNVFTSIQLFLLENLSDVTI
jgi:hypothetical protein